MLVCSRGRSYHRVLQLLLCVTSPGKARLGDGSCLSLGLDQAHVNKGPCRPFPECCQQRRCVGAQNWHLKGSEIVGRRQSDVVLPLHGVVEAAQWQKRSGTAAGLTFLLLGVYEDVSCISQVMQDTAQNSPKSHLK